MTEQTVIDLGTSAIITAMKISAPALGATLVTGLIVSIVQAATQINEQTISFIPKIIVLTIALAICGPWILETMLNYTSTIFTSISTMNR